MTGTAIGSFLGDVLYMHSRTWIIPSPRRYRTKQLLKSLSTWENTSTEPMVPAESALANFRSSAHRTTDKPRRVALVSLRFKPAFVSLLAALAKACMSLGFEVEFVVDSPYRTFPDLSALGSISAFDQLPGLHSYSHAFFFNVSPRNVGLAKALKASRTKVIYIYHEPGTSSLDRFRTEGVRGGITGALAHRVSAQLLKIADSVIIPSQYGTRIYQKKDIRHNPNYSCIPLLFDDEAANFTDRDKNYFSYIGAICQGHAFDEFLEYMRHSFRNDSPTCFLIASANSLPQHVMDEPLVREHRNKLKILAGRPLQNEEINTCYAESFCVWNLYHRSTQSAVLPKAFMFGTPVIATPLGAFQEYVEEGSNGRFVASPKDVSGITSAVEDIRQNLSQYSANARRSFLETFYYKNQVRNVALLLQQS